MWSTTNVRGLTDRQLEELATQVKNVVVSFMAKKGYINNELYVDLTSNYALIVRKKSFFRRLLEGKKEDKNLCFIIVRQENIVEEEEEEEEKDATPKDVKANLRVLSFEEDDEEKK